MKADVPVLAERAMLLLVSIALSGANEKCCLYPGVLPHQPSLVIIKNIFAPFLTKPVQNSP